MPERFDLLPSNATAYERALSLATDYQDRVDPNVVSMRGLKIGNPPPSFLPYLVYEYGLGELTPYVPNLYQLLREGIAWQRVRGTPRSVSLALDWLDYEAEIEEPSIRRARWNLFQLALNKVRESEADLTRIEGVTSLSVPLRSYFWRGFSGYDVRALEYGWNRWGQTRYSTYSGVRIDGGRSKWSFGRRYGFDHVLTDEELTDLGVYLPPAGSEPLGWGAFPWPAAPWVDNAARARSVAMLEALDHASAWVEFRRADNSVIGYRRARVSRPVQPAVGGAYRIGSARFEYRAAGATILYVEAMTDFGDGFGSTAASVRFILKGQPSPSHPVGALWLPPGGLVAESPLIAAKTVSIPFGRTVRERVSAVFRF
ncbi:MAG: phage tail protein [Burkholderiales bacterium]|nr:phage tail protein [Burkholderiales bacterium]